MPARWLSGPFTGRHYGLGDVATMTPAPLSRVERREQMSSVYAERQGIDPVHRLRVEFAVQMREQSAAARGFPFQPVAKTGRIDAQQHEIVLAGEMLGGGFYDLFGAGEMNETIAQVDRCAFKSSGAFGVAPERGGADFVDCGQCGDPAIWLGYQPLSRSARTPTTHAGKAPCIAAINVHMRDQIVHGEIMLKTEEYLVETADRCTRLAHEGRELIERLEAISNEMMAKAVELDTARDKNQKPAGKAGEASKN
jgi:hypothetical protein